MNIGLGIGITNIGKSNSVVYRADTLAYKSRVEADGGSIINLASVDAAYSMIATNSLTVAAAWSADWGVKKDGSNLVATWYSLAGEPSDLIAVGTARPTWTANVFGTLPAIVTDGTGNYMYRAFTLNQPETVLAVYRANTWNNADYIWDGGVNNGMALYQSTSSSNYNLYDGNTILTAISPLGILNTINQITVRYQSANHVVRINTTPVSVSAGGSTNAGGFSLARRSGLAGYADAAYCEIIILSVNMTDHSPVELYLRTKWGTPLP